MHLCALHDWSVSSESEKVLSVLSPGDCVYLVGNLMEDVF